MVNPQTITTTVGFISLAVIVIVILILKRKGKQIKNGTIAILLFLPIVFVIGAGVIYLLIRTPTEKALQAKIPEYQTFQKGVMSDEAYINGKMLIIYPAGNQIHPLYYQIPKDQQATSPEDISTVVIIDCRSSIRGYKMVMGNSEPIYDSSECETHIIDWENQIELLNKFISKDFASPELVWVDVLDYLESLPRK